MSDSPSAPPPRLIPERSFPRYAYVPGRTPHPTRDPDGHSRGHENATPLAPDPKDWRACADYLYGVDLFNHGFYWEAHEAWEGLWAACGRRGPTATYLQALINLAAAGLKARSGNAPGMRANAATAARLFASAADRLGASDGRYMGLDVRALAERAGTVSRMAEPGEMLARDGVSPAPDFALRPNDP